jgi:phosphoribosylamine--glycine ligase
MVVTGTGTTIEEARESAYSRVNKVVIPNARYRNDIGVRLIDADWARLAALGWVE